MCNQGKLPSDHATRFLFTINIYHNICIDNVVWYSEFNRNNTFETTLLFKLKPPSLVNTWSNFVAFSWFWKNGFLQNKGFCLVFISQKVALRKCTDSPNLGKFQTGGVYGNCVYFRKSSFGIETIDKVLTSIKERCFNLVFRVFQSLHSVSLNLCKHFPR